VVVQNDREYIGICILFIVLMYGWLYAGYKKVYKTNIKNIFYSCYINNYYN
jgi:hypothetical protein